MLYDNGEQVTKERMEDETWYPDYQMLMELTISLEKIDIATLINWFDKEYDSIYGKAYPNPEQLLRWCVLQVERHDT